VTAAAISLARRACAVSARISIVSNIEQRGPILLCTIDVGDKRLKLRKLSAVLLLCLCSTSRTRAGVTLFLGEPYGYDGWLLGTGHSAVYLSRVCAASPVVLRLCAVGESGIVISRYRSVAGYDWVAIPLIPYLYAVEKQEDVPLFADAKLVAFLRDRYRRTHLELLAPDLVDAGAPAGGWHELTGASYIRTIYAFEIETSPEHDALLIRKLNNRRNRQRWNLVTANCADFVREVINFYYPHAVHRSIIHDLGITTPKQSARMLSSYSRHHPELQTSTFVIPQVPGTVARSRTVHGILESALTAKKYMLPLFVWHPYIAGSLVAGYLMRGHFNPAKNALILDSNHQLEAPLTPTDRHAFQDRLEGLVQTASPEDAAADERRWASLHAAAEPTLDTSGGPTLQVRVGSEVTTVGIARANILGSPEGYEFAAGLVKARLREELKPAASRKTAPADFENDLALLQQLLTRQPEGFAITAGSLERGTQSPVAAH
jgi:hypothetical protein